MSSQEARSPERWFRPVASPARSACSRFPRRARREAWRHAKPRSSAIASTPVRSDAPGTAADLDAGCHHAVERCEMLVGLPPFAVAVFDAHAGAIANGECVCPAQPFARPLAFDLDFRVA